MGRCADTLRYVSESLHIALLQVILDIQPIDHQLGREGRDRRRKSVNMVKAAKR